jgi:hypothetical protein
MNSPDRKERFFIKVETWQRTVIRKRRQEIAAWCKQCDSEVLMFVPEAVAEYEHTTIRSIYRRVENGELHFLETIEGELFICCQSLKPKEIPNLSREAQK